MAISPGVSVILPSFIFLKRLRTQIPSSSNQNCVSAILIFSIGAILNIHFGAIFISVVCGFSVLWWRFEVVVRLLANCYGANLLRRDESTEADVQGVVPGPCQEEDGPYRCRAGTRQPRCGVRARTEEHQHRWFGIFHSSMWIFTLSLISSFQCLHFLFANYKIFSLITVIIVF